jgi:DNA (cytosine-5)-methyltransferase 1
MNGLDLFAGSGIGSLALKNIIPNYKTVCYVEWEPYCQAILISRIKDGFLDDAPIWDDVRTFDGKQWGGKVDIVYGGFPCQPFSQAGQRQGESDERNCWPDTIRIISEIRPRFAFVENVPGLLVSGYIPTILSDFAKIGYDVEWDCVPAAFVGAPIIRSRLWFMAISQGLRPFYVRLQVNGKERSRGKEAIRGGNREISPNRKAGNPISNNQWAHPPEPIGVVDGLANQLERLKMLGNGWVPQVVKRILSVSGSSHESS